MGVEPTWDRLFAMQGICETVSFTDTTREARALEDF